MDADMTQEKTVICEVCSCLTPISSSVVAGNRHFCSKDCCIKAKAMPHRKHVKSRLGVSFKKVTTFDWGHFLDTNNCEAVPLANFKHCMLDSFLYLEPGVKLEVALPRNERSSDEVTYWIATVVKTAGYKVKLRYEGYGTDDSHDFWANICSSDVHHIGYCAKQHKSLAPPTSLGSTRTDWRDYILKRITGCRTLPENFYSLFIKSVGNHKFCKGMVLEVVDKTCIAAMKVAQVSDIVDCRLHLEYEGATLAPPESKDFWCHKDSGLVHPVGWSVSVGHRLHASTDYTQNSRSKVALGTYSPDDCTPDMFKPLPKQTNGSSFAVGMKLEAIDPLNLANICVATVMEVLKDGYLMIGIDGCMDMEDGTDWFCYHRSSASILPAGFCSLANIPLTPPKSYQGKFSWKTYLSSTQSIAAPVALFDLTLPASSFLEGCKLEAVDLMDPRLICVATVKQSVGRLIKLHFDGWEESFDQWLDCESPDIYPVGWCEVMKYNLEGPRVVHVPVNTESTAKFTSKSKGSS